MTKVLKEEKVIKYLVFFFCFLFSILAYLTVVTLIDFSETDTVPNDLLPYYKPYIKNQSHKLFAYSLAVLGIPALTVTLLAVFSAPLSSLLSKRKTLTFALSLLSFTIVLLASFFVLYKGLSSLPFFQKLKPIFATTCCNSSSKVNLSQLPNKVSIAVLTILTIFGGVLSIFLYFTASKNFLAQLSKIGTQKKLLVYFTALVLIVLTLLDRSFDEKNLFIGRTFQYIHTAVFVGPLQDILYGKALLVDSSSQYGIFLNYLPAVIFKILSPIVSLSFTSFFYLMIVYGIIYYIFIFLLLEKRFSNPLFSLVSLLVFFSLHFYAMSYRYIRPMVFPIRYLLGVPFFFFLLSLSKVESFKKHLFFSSYLAFSIFYNLETGVSLTIAYFVYLSIETYRQKGAKSAKKYLLILLRHFATFSAFLTLTALLYSIYAQITTGHWPNFKEAFFFIQIFSRGFISSDEGLIGFHLFPILIYLIFLTRGLTSVLKKRFSQNLSFDTSLAVYGALIFIYYVERSYFLNIPTLSIPAIFLGLVLLSQIYKKARSSSSFFYKMSLLGPYFVLSQFIAFSLVFYPYRLYKNQSHNYFEGDRQASRTIYENVAKAAKLIQKYELDKKRVAMLFSYDTLLSIKADKVNSLPFTTSQNVFTESQTEKVFDFLKKDKPEHIFVDKDPWLSTNIYPQIYHYIYKYYHLVDESETIEVWRKKA